VRSAHRRILTKHRVAPIPVFPGCGEFEQDVTINLNVMVIRPTWQ
jgi:hypothetical protein